MKEEIEGTKRVVRVRKSKKDREPNGHEKKIQQDKQRKIHTKLTIEKQKPL